ncbi:hypothetical protein SDC9_117422 [bioreactor metagenome]|uniref:Uncharacterized protein n=1 Tax=bioreactor metagenome TaxID=1076179 RepID=A0A645BZ86_9ZZZZ
MNLQELEYRIHGLAEGTAEQQPCGRNRQDDNQGNEVYRIVLFGGQ